MRIKTLFILLAGLIFILVYSLTFTYSSIRHRDVQIKSAEDSMLRDVKQEYSVIDFYFALGTEQLDRIANDPSIIGSLAQGNKENIENASQILTRRTAGSGIFQIIGLHDMDCVLITAGQNARAVIGTNFSYRDYCQGVLSSKKVYISQSFKNALNNQTVIAIAVPVKDASGQMIGFVLGLVDLTLLDKTLSEPLNDESLILLDRNGQPFIDSVNPDMAGKDYQQEEKNLVDSNFALEHFEGSLERKKSSEEGSEIIVFKKYEYVTIIINKDSNIALAPFFEFDRFLLESFFVTSLVFLIVLWFAARYVSRPIEDLSDKFKMISRGNLKVFLGKSNISEIQSLIDSLNTVLSSVKISVLGKKK